MRKYKKASRYFQYFSNILRFDDHFNRLNEFQGINFLNIAAVELKLENYVNAKSACTDAIKYDPKNSKALYRRGQAEIALRNYEEALRDLKRAHKLAPDSKVVLCEFEKAKLYLLEYRKKEKLAIMKMFK